jgi:excinuclease UvrABC helicase subunit UvrB
VDNFPTCGDSDDRLRSVGVCVGAISSQSGSSARSIAFQTLMGVTGSGKTFTMAHTIARMQSADAGHQP